ncbi:hypothetical protein [Mucilaginibacter paludis]|uniref:Outer membrane protein beta-barrel domain-containing protein n=1 Tax=Mucilaginibacter paludis DSM 18603 TaxID=714943 RepID=H1Y7U0_9SPHI|nr:hypothetical protein [Mucilaginibacter paludis]EHQ30426.1 hypothetical protein Mucpa_6372 [Mucilaginibacter paludis DSM 18603]
MKHYLLIILAVFPFLSQAQKATTQLPHPVSVQLQAGTQGIGADVRYGVYPNLSARLGGSFVPINTGSSLSISGFNTDYSADVKIFNVHLLADYVPFKNIKNLRVVGGAAYLYKANGGLVLSPTGSYTFGNYNLTGPEIGKLDMDVSWKGVAPYLGVGLFKSFPSNLFNFNLDLGTYYLTAPSTRITGTNLLVDNNQLEPQFNDNLKGYRWLPVLQLNFNFKIR